MPKKVKTPVIRESTSDIDVRQVLLEYQFDTTAGEYKLHSLVVAGVEGEITTNAFVPHQTGREIEIPAADLPPKILTEAQKLKDDALDEYITLRGIEVE